VLVYLANALEHVFPVALLVVEAFAGFLVFKMVGPAVAGACVTGFGPDDGGAGVFGALVASGFAVGFPVTEPGVTGSGFWVTG